MTPYQIDLPMYDWKSWFSRCRSPGKLLEDFQQVHLFRFRQEGMRVSVRSSIPFSERVYLPLAKAPTGLPPLTDRVKEANDLVINETLRKKMLHAATPASPLTLWLLKSGDPTPAQVQV